MTADRILKDCREKMGKSVEHLQREMRGLRTGRATTALIEFIKVDYYGSPTELRELAAISTPDPALLMVKPFDPGSVQTIVKAIETADLGLNPMSEGGSIRISVPAPSTERRKQLVAQVRKMAEEARVAIRNERRDANKHIDALVKSKNAPLSEDQAKSAKDQVETATKAHVKQIDETSEKKIKEVETV